MKGVTKEKRPKSGNDNEDDGKTRTTKTTTMKTTTKTINGAGLRHVSRECEQRERKRE